MAATSLNPDRMVRLRPRAPLILRDARSFSTEAGARATTLEWPLPQTIAGALRTAIGDALGLDWRGDGPAIARRLVVHGPLLVAQQAAGEGWQAYLPAPRDALTFSNASGERQCRALRPHDPLLPGAGSNLPAGLIPLMIPADAKPDPPALFWSLADQIAWLTAATPSGVPQAVVGALPRETRIHMGIDHARRAAKTGALFSTTGLAFPDEPAGTVADGLGPRRALPADGAALALLCRVVDPPAAWLPATAFVSVGGERRLAAIEPAPADEWPDPPPALMEAVTGARRLRLQLVTLGIFPEGGWRPDWIDLDTLQGSVPGLPGLSLRLVAAAVGRRVPVSGWDLQARGGKGQPKAVRYAVPAGSVYFFEVAGGQLTAADVARLWLRSIAPDAQDQRDGYGLAVPGVW